MGRWRIRFSAKSAASGQREEGDTIVYGGETLPGEGCTADGGKKCVLKLVR
ncbi:hypothetical protein KCP73_16680 [Salmonella enterica subsp. enterica]|nr:hypothetical protein KCP73_16680 [Salmonella enterica subsp. enterica]